MAHLESKAGFRAGSSELNMRSTGNSVASLRRPYNSNPRAYRPEPWFREIVVAVRDRADGETPRGPYFHGLADEFFPAALEHLLGLGIDLVDTAFRVHDNYGVRREFKDAVVQFQGRAAPSRVCRRTLER